MYVRGDVVLTNPSDFVGSALGQSEEKTNAILERSIASSVFSSRSGAPHSSSTRARPVGVSRHKRKSHAAAKWRPPRSASSLQSVGASGRRPKLTIRLSGSAHEPLGGTIRPTSSNHAISGSAGEAD